MIKVQNDQLPMQSLTMDWGNAVQLHVCLTMRVNTYLTAAVMDKKNNYKH